MLLRSIVEKSFKCARRSRPSRLVTNTVFNLLDGTLAESLEEVYTAIRLGVEELLMEEDRFDGAGPAIFSPHPSRLLTATYQHLIEPELAAPKIEEIQARLTGEQLAVAVLSSAVCERNAERPLWLLAGIRRLRRAEADRFRWRLKLCWTRRCGRARRLSIPCCAKSTSGASGLETFDTAQLLRRPPASPSILSPTCCGKILRRRVGTWTHRESGSSGGFR